MASTINEQKAQPTNDAYTGMLAVSLFALLVGCLFLYMDYNQYGEKPPDKIKLIQTARPASDWPAPPPKEKTPDEPPPPEPKDDQPKGIPDKKGLP